MLDFFYRTQQSQFDSMKYNLDISKTKVLIVDDQRSFQIMLKGMLSNLGFAHIDYADNGEMAIRKCKDIEFDLILADYNLGANKKNGRQLLEELRSRKMISPRCLYIIVTGENTRAIVMGAIESQPDDYIMKPFSQMQIKSRIGRSYNKKIALENVYAQLQDKNYDAAVLNCRRLIQEGSKYSNFCRNLLAELYCNVGEHERSVALLKELLKERDLSWAKISLGKTYTEMGEYSKALEIFEEQIKRHPMLLDAYDYLARCHLASGDKEMAQKNLETAISISPHSVSRQQALANVASMNGNVKLTRECHQAVYELSKRSIHQSPEHLCNYIRSTFKHAAESEEPSRKHKLNQEAMTAIFRAKQENFYTGFDYDAFEGLCQASLQSQKGEYLKAKKTLYTAASSYLTEPDDELPLEFSPEALETLMRIGEFEVATELAERMDKEDTLEPGAQQALDQFKKSDSGREKLQKFKEFKREGMRCYDAGNFEGAIDSFNHALSVAPTNTGAALNCIQSSIQLLKSQRKPDPRLILNCQQHFRLLDGVPLPVHHKQRYNELKQQFIDIKHKR